MIRLTPGNENSCMAMTWYIDRNDSLDIPKADVTYLRSQSFRFKDTLCMGERH